MLREKLSQDPVNILMILLYYLAQQLNLRLLLLEIVRN